MAIDLLFSRVSEFAQKNTQKKSGSKKSLKNTWILNLNWINDRGLQLTAFIKKILEQFGAVVIGFEFSPVQPGPGGVQNTIT